MKNALLGVLNIAMYTTPMSSFFIWPGHMKNPLVCVVSIAMFKTPTSALFVWPSFTPVNSFNRFVLHYSPVDARGDTITD